jgi:predicted metalloprotease with PDZ domain
MTQFWGTALPVRAGLISQETHREMLAVLAGNFDVQSGNRWRPLADTAVEAQVLYDAPDAWELARRGTDFYEASVFLWMNVDAQLRTLSNGHASIDDFARRFFAGAGGEPALKPYSEADVYATLAAVAPGDWRGLIHHHLDDLGPAALLAGLESAGWRLEYSAAKNSFLETRQKRRKEIDRQWSIGLKLSDDAKDRGAIIDTAEERAAPRAGAGPGMKVIAVNGERLSAEVLDAAILAAHATHTPIELLLENGDYYKSVSVPYFDGPRFPHIVRIEGRTDTLTQMLQPRSD